MKSLYLLVDLVTIFFPIVLSFDKKVTFYTSWKYALTSSFIIGIPFLVWDSCFTANSIWGFNPDYLTGIAVFNLPLEEVLFFLIVPFSCLFIYTCCTAYFKHVNFRRLNGIVYILILAYILFIAIFGYHGAYAQAVVLSASITLFFILFFERKLVYLPVSFLISLLPFLVVNGLLTGSFTAEPIVWYDDTERTPFRIFTIPAEDILYSFTLIGLNILVFTRISNPKKWN